MYCVLFSVGRLSLRLFFSFNFNKNSFITFFLMDCAGFVHYNTYSVFFRKPFMIRRFPLKNRWFQGFKREIDISISCRPLSCQVSARKLKIGRTISHRILNEWSWNFKAHILRLVEFQPLTNHDRFGINLDEFLETSFHFFKVFFFLLNGLPKAKLNTVNIDAKSKL